MNDVRPAVLLAQTVVGGTDVEKQQVTLAAGIGRLQERIGRQVGDDERDAFLCHCQRLRRSIDIGLDRCLRHRETLVEKPASRVVVHDREFGAGQTVVLSRHLDQ